MPDDPRARAKVAVKPARALRRDAVDELDLTHRLQRRIGPGPVERAAFHEHGADNVVAAVRIGMECIERVVRRRNQRLDKRMQRLREHADQRAQVPQMVVRIDDRQIGFDDLFSNGFWHGSLS